MAMKNRKCVCCNTTYSYCPDCSKVDKIAPSWRSQFCSESCMMLWSTLTKFGIDRLTKSEAKEIVSTLDLKPIDTYVACVQRDYAKVMVEEKKPKRNKRIEIKPIDEPIVEDIIPEVVQEEAYEVVTQENE